MSSNVTIVVPVYNVEPYLRECLDSVLAQTFADWECVCVDDGSTDGSSSILSEYAGKDHRFQIIRQPNGGLSSARNAGMDAATGKYLYFLDSDDMLVEEALERLQSLAEKDELDQIVFGTKLFVQAGIVTDARIADMERYYSVQQDFAGSVMSGLDLFRGLVDRNAFFASVPLRFFRRRSLPESLRFPEGLLHEDNYFSPLALLAANRALAVTDRLYIRRVRAGSIMTSQNRRAEHAESLKTIYTMLGRPRPSGISVGRARLALNSFRRDIYRQYLGFEGRNPSFAKRALDIKRAYGTKAVFRSVLRKLLFRQSPSSIDNLS